jgi:sigma-E factor negative regulatory protein RseB
MRGLILTTALGLALSAPVFAAGPAQPGASPADLLVGMSEAARTGTYQGVIVYQGDGSQETMRVTHRFDGGVERERVQSLTGEPREILKQDGKVICLLPKDRKLTMQRPTPKGIFMGLTPERLAQIVQVYEIKDLGHARIAGRECHGVAIQPRDAFRYGYQVWADDATQVPLQVDLVDRRDNRDTVLERMMFTEIEFPSSIPESAFQTALDPSQYREVTRSLAEPGAPPSAQGSQFDNTLPRGFRVTMREVRPMADGHGTVEHLLLSDGLSAISVFTARHESQGAQFQGTSNMGAVNAYGRLVGHIHITVVGEAPRETVKLIGDSVKPGESPEADSGTAAPAHKP